MARIWLRAITGANREDHGEGLWIQLDTQAPAAWEARPELGRRAGVLRSGWDRELGDVPDMLFFGPRYYMLHALSHLVTQAISALELGRLCSNDPVCATHSLERDQSERHLEGAAYHGCLCLAEVDTGQVLRELFEAAERHVIIAGFAFWGANTSASSPRSAPSCWPRRSSNDAGVSRFFLSVPTERHCVLQS